MSFADEPAPSHGLRVAYLTSRYPATSHTFIHREVGALRAIGVCVDTFSVRPPSAPELQCERLHEEWLSTFTLLQQPLYRFVTAHISTIATRPLSYLRTFWTALEHREPGLGGLFRGLAHFVESVLLARVLVRRRITRLHNHFANSGATVGYLAAQLVGLRWSFTIHGISETDYPAGLMLARKINAADFVACASYFGRAQAMRLVSPAHWDKLHVVRCGLSMEMLPPLKPKRNRATKRLICVGRLSPEKGHAGLLQAFSAAAKELGPLELVIIGDGPESQRLRALSTELGVSNMVHFAGRCGEQLTLEQIRDADILVLPSFMEGLPIVLLEALALGTPVIASRVAGIPELIEHCKTGLLFTPSRWDELKEMIQLLLRDEALAKRLSGAGRSVVASEFRLENSAKRLRELLSA